MEQGLEHGFIGLVTQQSIALLVSLHNQLLTLLHKEANSTGTHTLP